MPELNIWAYVIDLHDYKVVRTHWIGLYMIGNIMTYFDGFGVTYIPKEIENSYRTKILWQKFIECNLMILQCADTFVLDLLILWFF